MDLPPVEVMNNPNQSPDKLLAEGLDNNADGDKNADDLEA